MKETKLDHLETYKNNMHAFNDQTAFKSEKSNGEMVLFEQPLNEPFRICLRLEHLFQLYYRHKEQNNIDSSRMVVTSLIDIINVIERPDLRSKLMQLLAQQATTLAQLEQFPQVDKTKLKNTLTELDQLIKELHQCENKIAGQLRANPFLYEIRLQLNSPGGACNFNTPAFALWLQQPFAKRLESFKSWENELVILMKVVKLILQLSRDSSTSQKISAPKGFFQQALDANLSCQMIRIFLPQALNAYPKISFGNHRISIQCYLMNPISMQPSEKMSENIEFSLAYCRL